MMKQKLASKIIHKVILAIFVVLLAFPFFWMAIATFKQDADLYATQNNPFLFNLRPTLDHLRYTLERWPLVVAITTGWLPPRTGEAQEAPARGTQAGSVSGGDE